MCTNAVQLVRSSGWKKKKKENHRWDYGINSIGKCFYMYISMHVYNGVKGIIRENNVHFFPLKIHCCTKKNIHLYIPSYVHCTMYS